MSSDKVNLAGCFVSDTVPKNKRIDRQSADRDITGIADPATINHGFAGVQPVVFAGTRGTFAPAVNGGFDSILNAIRTGAAGKAVSAAINFFFREIFDSVCTGLFWWRRWDQEASGSKKKGGKEAQEKAAGGEKKRFHQGYSEVCMGNVGAKVVL